MRLERKHVLLVVAVLGLAVAGIVVARRVPFQRDRGQTREGRSSDQPVPAAVYADPGICASCHEEIARTYGRTGMARSFSKLPVESGPGASFVCPPGENCTRSLFHEASGRHYTIAGRGGRVFLRRHDVGFDGKDANTIEVEASHVVGSGNHARTFLHRKPDGRLLEMPVSWYAERGDWAMSPGYDRAAHLDFRRLINEDCMACHNGYPRSNVENVGDGPKFAEPLPEGIDCQRCHGPGQAHVDAINARDVEAARRAIIDPGKLERVRQLETCMQCHLEPTSSPLPFQIRRYEQPPFSYTPGKPLGDYFMYFDHAAGSGREDKFEIASGAYRLRQSACFQRSEMTCVTCHDPHDIPRGAQAVQHYVTVCQSCHQGVHTQVPEVQHAGARATCLDCHMPRRRTEDAVHVVMTDHYIQRRRPARDLLAPLKEADNFEHGNYRGEVVPYYPANPAATPDNELYVALAQVQQGSNLAAGITRLEEAIKRHNPRRADFYYEVARAHSKASNDTACIRWCEEALRRDAGFSPALKELAAAATRLGLLTQAAQALEKAVRLRPGDGDAFADLGNVYLQQDRVDEARGALQRALAIDADTPRANNTMGLTALRKGETDAAERYFRAAIRAQPDLAEAQNNLGHLLAGRKAYAEAGYHFERAIRSDPNYVQARHSYGVVLAVMRAYPAAADQLRAAIRLNPRLASAHIDLGDVLAAMGRIEEAAREYERAIETSSDPEVRQAAIEALRALKR